MKYVLPAMAPELKYEEMEISDGAMAAKAWLRLWEMEDSAEIDRVRDALLEYCELDTFAMMRILEKLVDIC